MPLEDAVLAQAYQLEALMNVLEKRGLLSRADVLAEIKALQAKTPKARSRCHGLRKSLKALACVCVEQPQENAPTI